MMTTDTTTTKDVLGVYKPGSTQDRKSVV